MRARFPTTSIPGPRTLPIDSVSARGSSSKPRNTPSRSVSPRSGRSRSRPLSTGQSSPLRLEYFVADSSSPAMLSSTSRVLTRLPPRTCRRYTATSSTGCSSHRRGLRGSPCSRWTPGWRAALIAGPDVWEVAAAVKNSSARSDAAIAATAGEMGLSSAQVKTALDYFSNHPDEIEGQIAENERSADEALRAWEAQQRLLA